MGILTGGGGGGNSVKVHKSFWNTHVEIHSLTGEHGTSTIDEGIQGSLSNEFSNSPPQ